MVAPEPECEQVSDSRTQPMSRLDADPVQATKDGRQKLNGKPLEYTISARGKPEKVPDEPKPTEPKIKKSCGVKSLKRASGKANKDNRPLVLEERHSLSIAETKKRRASVFSEERLFIPKELARSNLLQQRGSSVVNSLDKLSRNADYCLRMLKFPVGTGRARFVANQMKKGQMAGLQGSSKEPPDESEMIGDGNAVATCMEAKAVEGSPIATKEEAVHMPDLDAERAANDPLIHIQVIIDTDDDDDDEDINYKSEATEQGVGAGQSPPAMQDQCHSVIKVCNQLMSENGGPSEQPYPYLRWHNPDRELLDIKMGLLEDLRNISEAEANHSAAENNQQVITSEEAQEESSSTQQVPTIPQTQHQPLLEPLTSNPPLYQSVHQIQHPRVDALTQPHASCCSVPLAVSSSFPATEAAEGHSHSILCQRLQHHSVLPSVETFQPSSVCHNSRVDLANQHFRQQQHVDFESLLPSALVYPWSQQSLDFYPEQQQLQLAQAQAQAQQRLFAQPPVRHIIPQLSQQHQQQVVCQQTVLASMGELEKLKAMQQNLKLQEEEQQRFFYTTLKAILSERADDEQMFQFKMKQSKKAEDKLKADKEKQQRQLRADLHNLDTRIRDQQRQLAWRQHQQQLLLQHPIHQQQQPQQQQQHILPHYPQRQVAAVAESQRKATKQHHPPAMFERPPYVYPPSSSYSTYGQPSALNVASAATGSEFHTKLMPPPALKKKAASSSAGTVHKRMTKAQEAELRREINERRATPYPAPSVEIHYPTAAVSSSTFPAAYHFQPIYTPSPPARSQQQRAPDPEHGSARATTSTFITNFVSSYLNEHMRTNK
ncbi:transcription factor SPT20 homolog [Drosophila obscura]|uniref:transcription factor SPT20 homolog n=1 Tax=Drosophila obscura TaxID=7282 RepID=UPI001BB13784|nr:transcription factor SPT20 homolog [Drosophila obscura]